MNTLRCTLAAARAAAWGALALLALGAAQPSPAAAFDTKAAERSTLRVLIVVERDGKKILAGKGSGFVIDNGYVATNQHVADPDEFRQKSIRFELYVVNIEHKKPLLAELVWASKELDLAVLRVKGLDLKPLELTSRPPLEYPGKAELLYTVGYPGISDTLLESQTPQQQDEVMIQATVTQGVVGRIVNATMGGRFRPIIQHDANFNPGNSGGPLFDNCNRIVGVNTFYALTQLQIIKDERGNQIARGGSPGVYFSPHVSNLVAAVKTVPELKGIRLRLSDEYCTAGGGETSPLLIALVGITLVVALGAIALAVFRRREVVRVVESYSAWVHRKGVEPGARRGDSAALPRPPARPPAPPRRSAGAASDMTARPAAAGEPAAPPLASGNWVLSGVDSNRQKVSLTISPVELDKAASQSEKGLVLGRSASMADKVVNDPSVSRRHARITRSGEGLALEDLKSAYGTKVNGQSLQPFQPTSLQPGDQIVIGAVTLDLARG